MPWGSDENNILMDNCKYLKEGCSRQRQPLRQSSGNQNTYEHKEQGAK